MVKNFFKEYVTTLRTGNIIFSDKFYMHKGKYLPKLRFLTNNISIYDSDETILQQISGKHAITLFKNRLYIVMYTQKQIPYWQNLTSYLNRLNTTLFSRRIKSYATNKDWDVSRAIEIIRSSFKSKKRLILHFIDDAKLNKVYAYIKSVYPKQLYIAKISSLIDLLKNIKKKNTKYFFLINAKDFNFTSNSNSSITMPNVPIRYYQNYTYTCNCNLLASIFEVLFSNVIIVKNIELAQSRVKNKVLYYSRLSEIKYKTNKESMFSKLEGLLQNACLDQAQKPVIVQNGAHNQLEHGKYGIGSISKYLSILQVITSKRKYKTRVYNVTNIKKFNFLPETNYFLIDSELEINNGKQNVCQSLENKNAQNIFEAKRITLILSLKALKNKMDILKSVFQHKFLVNKINNIYIYT